MFLKVMQERNPELIDASIQMHQKGDILPDTYVIDVDRVVENAEKLKEAADAHGIELYFMLKQMGRNPYLAQKIIEAGIEKAVVVDFKEAQVMMDNNIPIGNIGHLVQVPDAMLREVLTYGVDHITVYSIEKMRAIHRVAKDLNIQQNVLLRVVDDGDNQYPGQYSGLRLEELEGYIEEFKQLSHLVIDGVTSFPCFLYSDKVGKVIPTKNLQTLKSARKILKAHDIDISVMNTPSCSAVSTMADIKRFGGNQGEPGHALTGSSPMHAEYNLPEKPAYTYVSEVSHNYEGHAYIYGGGYYRRGHLDYVLFAADEERTMGHILPFADSNIDYFLESDKEQPVGATAVMSFRTQIFTTRSDVALVEGLSKNAPKLVGIYDSQGKYLRG